jgi:hypothetical protein
VYEGPVRAVAASADGAWIAFLEGCREVKGQYLPPRTASCDLRLVPSAGGEARRIAQAVTTLPHAMAWAPEGALLAALAEYDYGTGTGTLVTVDGNGRTASRQGVSFHLFAPGGARVLAIAGGVLVPVGPAAEDDFTWPVVRADGLSSFELAPGAPKLAPRDPAALIRRPAQSGGTLLAVSAKDGKVSPVAEKVGDYRFSPAGGVYAFTVQGRTGYGLRLAAGSRTEPLGEDVRDFAFSRDGGAIAWIADAVPGKQGDLRVAPIRAGATASATAAVLGREVGVFRWARAAPRLAWLERYDPRVGSGTVAAQRPDGKPRTFVPNVSELDLSPDGTRLAFLQHTTRGGYSVDLGLARLDAPAAEPFQPVAQGVFGFSFSPDGKWLYYRTRCTRNGEACDLERLPAAGPASGAKPEVIAQAAKSFEFDPRDPERLLVTWQRVDRDALDVAVWDQGKLTTVDTYVAAGTARFLGPDSRRLVYAVIHEKRQGVYVAELPKAPAR